MINILQCRCEVTLMKDISQSMLQMLNSDGSHTMRQEYSPEAPGTQGIIVMTRAQRSSGAAIPLKATNISRKHPGEQSSLISD